MVLRPGLHLSNAIGITDADLDIIKRWSPLSLLENMGDVVNSEPERLAEAWEVAGRPPLVVRRYYTPPEGGGGPATWGAHAVESMDLAHRCEVAGIPRESLMLKPFNEPNMPRWAVWEGFGDRAEHMARYNEALLQFMAMVRAQMPGLRVGGPHLTVGNRDVRFPSDPPGVYYYHGEDMRFESSPCSEALSQLDVHFVHCYGMHPGQYKERGHGLRFLEYEKYLVGKDVYIVEGAYGTGAPGPWTENTVRGEETVAYLRLLDEYPQVKGIALWIGGDRGWDAFRFADSFAADPGAYRPVVFYVEAACEGGDEPTEPQEPSEPGEGPEYVGLTEEMIGALRIDPPLEPSQPHHRVVRVEVLPEWDSMSAFAVLPSGDPGPAVWTWADGGTVTDPKDDAYAPPAARWNAASMPMFNPWGAYSVKIEGNSEVLVGFGLYASDLNIEYKGHHPVIVTFDRVDPGAGDGDGGEEPTEPPYRLVTRLATAPHGFADLRDEIESFSDLTRLERERREFRDVRMLVVHHSGSDEAHSPLSVARYHVLDKAGSKEATIPYHFVIDQEGRLHFTARLVWVTAHASSVGPWDRISVGACVLGDLRERKPSGAQVEALRFLLACLHEFFGGGWGRYRGLWVVPHGAITGSECPGRLLDEFVWRDWAGAPFFREPPGDGVDG